jgi:hypothetical protein
MEKGKKRSKSSSLNESKGVVVLHATPLVVFNISWR